MMSSERKARAGQLSVILEQCGVVNLSHRGPAGLISGVDSLDASPRGRTSGWLGAS